MQTQNTAASIKYAIGVYVEYYKNMDHIAS